MGYQRVRPEMKNEEISVTQATPANNSSANTGTLRQFISRLMGAVQRITGKTNWYEPPDYSLAQLRAQILLGANYKTARVATTAVLTLGSPPGAVDGITLADGDRILVKNQTTTTQNGIYVNTAGVWTRADDMNSSDEVFAGLAVYIESGAVNGDKLYVITTDNPITLDTTGFNFGQFPPLGTTTIQGLLELATIAEGEAGADTARATTPQVVRAMANNLAKKADVRAATTANMDLTGAETIDGVVLATGNRVLVKNQTAPAENGIYVANTAGAWTRAEDADSSADFAFGQEVRVREGAQAGVFYLSSTTVVTVGTTGVAYSTSTSATAHAFWSSAHTDVDTADAPADGQVPVYRTSNSKFNLEKMKPAPSTIYAAGDINAGTGKGHDPVDTGQATAITIAADSAPAGGTVTVTIVREAGGPGGSNTTVGSVTFAIGDRLETTTLGSPVSTTFGDTLRMDITTGAGYTAGSCKNLTAKTWMG